MLILGKLTECII